MSSETLENERPQAEEEVQAEENHTDQEDTPVKNHVSENGNVKEKDEVEEETDERDEAKSSKSPEESGYATPTSKRPTRERKTVDRYTVSSPDKFHKSSSLKASSIEKGNGTQLKDIPNVAFKLSKRKADENLHALHKILFGQRGKAIAVKRNIGLFSGYVWTDNEEKLKAKTKEKIEKCAKEKLVDFCNVLNIPINKTTMKKEELSAKLFEFLVSPHATTDVLLADKKMKGRKRGRKPTPNKSETPAKKQKKTSIARKKQKQSSDVEESDVSEPSEAEVDSEEDDVPKSESDHDDENMSEKEEDKEKAHTGSSTKTLNEDQDEPAKKTTTVETTKSNEKTPKRSTSKIARNDNTSKSKQSTSNKQKTVRENQNSKRKVADKKRTDKSSKALVKDGGKGKRSEKAEDGPSKNEMHRVVVDILKKVDFNTATLSDILKQLGTHFDVDLMHRKAEVKDIITDVINNMSDNDKEETSNVGDDDGEDEALL
ncbi:DEK domain-containing chromatin-associated protein 1-like [Vigna umbellata]|uniref:DEK domain-containing chromatin-associated protein 1-like n=1 Tax=Vigna umbellata TaxID=87088 RepID=UPI001F5F5E53|nr:DEK domain-containing chromatin-associated protein 1-like [Vigna umbellata]